MPEQRRKTGICPRCRTHSIGTKRHAQSATGHERGSWCGSGADEIRPLRAANGLTLPRRRTG